MLADYEQTFDELFTLIVLAVPLTCIADEVLMALFTLQKSGQMDLQGSDEVDRKPATTASAAAASAATAVDG